jgi:hypothetical protein
MLLSSNYEDIAVDFAHNAAREQDFNSVKPCKAVLDRKFPGVGPLEDTIDIGRGAPLDVGNIRGIGHQPTIDHEFAQAIGRRQRYCAASPTMLAVNGGERLRRDDQSVVGSAGKFFEGVRPPPL